ncbi:MAG: threonine/serine exporter family protein [Treponemataceae bacterium]|nr:threonine/serine exporter family protein [Treponemataceae bacterium]
MEPLSQKKAGSPEQGKVAPAENARGEQSLSSPRENPLIVAAEAGKKILEAGGETYRAEEMVVRLCRLWSCKDAECFATPTGIMASITGEDGRSYGVVRRISRRSVNLHKLGALIHLVERAEQEKLDEHLFLRFLHQLEAAQPYPLPISLGAAGLSTFFFTLLFQGAILDGLAAFFVGIGIKLVMIQLQKRNLPDFITHLVGGMVVALLSGACFSLGLGKQLDKIIIGSIMLLVPGLATVNAIRDTMAGDLVAGIARFADAIITAMAIAMGVLLVVVWG